MNLSDVYGTEETKNGYRRKKKKGVYQLPTDIFTYTANTGIPVTEAVAIIAITRFEQKPLPIDYRELNIHVW